MKNESDEENNIINNKTFRKLYNFGEKCWEYFRTITEYDFDLIEKEPSFYASTAGGKPEETFIVKDRMTNYNSAQRSMIVFQILLRAKFDDGEKCGIRRLINDGTYQSCFPLHEGRYDKPHPSGTVFDRRVCFIILFHLCSNKLINAGTRIGIAESRARAFDSRDSELLPRRVKASRLLNFKRLSGKFFILCLLANYL